MAIRPSYTRLLMASPPTTQGTYLSEAFDPSDLVVVRDMQFLAPTGYLPLEGFRVDGASGATPMWFMGPGNTKGNTHYSWQGRVALEPGDQIQIEAFEDNWSWSVTGYIFLGGA